MLGPLESSPFPDIAERIAVLAIIHGALPLVLGIYLLALLALLGAWLCRGPRLLVLLVSPAVATLAAVTYGAPRLRHGADVVVLALAGVALAWLLER